VHATAEAKHRSASQEREELAHAISHDLAQPLTTISGFARLLLSRYDIELDEEAREQLNTIAERAGDIQQMIDDVVTSLRDPVAVPSRQTVAA
jgi:two-component system, sensor histidine kinase and response regulator